MLSDADRQFYGQIVRRVFQKYGISSPTPWEEISDRRKLPHMDVAEAVIDEFIGNTNHQDHIESTHGISPASARMFVSVPISDLSLLYDGVSSDLGWEYFNDRANADVWERVRAMLVIAEVDS